MENMNIVTNSLNYNYIDNCNNVFSKAKRDRSKNFLPVEREQLLQICSEFIDIIEDKKTDSHTCKKKYEAWVEIANKFNAVQTTGFRNDKHLKTLYDNMKRDLKKQKNGDKVQLFSGSQYVNNASSFCNVLISESTNSYEHTENDDQNPNKNESTSSFIIQPESNHDEMSSKKGGTAGVQRSIDLFTKQKILKEVDSGVMSKTKIAEKFKIPKSTLSTIIKSKEKIDAAIASGSSGSSKRLRKASHEDVESELLNWLKKVRNSNVPITGRLIKERAKEISASIGIVNFECSDGWLWRFQKRHNTSSRIYCGESKKIDEEGGVNEWLNKFNELRKWYDEKDIFNLVEASVFYNLLPNCSLDFERVKCYGDANSNERLTAVLCCNANGSEKLKLWVIGKYKNIRCFNKDRLILPFIYTHQRNASLDLTSFRLWLLKFQRRMASENRHVLLMLDNCSAHNVDELDLPNIKVLFFPANCTSIVQPLDLGIISTFKWNFKTRLVKNALLCIESEQPNLKWNILQVMRAMAASWDCITDVTIVNCFRKAWKITGQSDNPSTSEFLNHNFQDPEEWMSLVSVMQPDNKMSFAEFIEMDNNVAICDSNESADCINPEKEEVMDLEEKIEMPSRNEIFDALNTLQRFSQTSGDLDLSFEDYLDKIRSECLKRYPIK